MGSITPSCCNQATSRHLD